MARAGAVVGVPGAMVAGTMAAAAMAAEATAQTTATTGTAADEWRPLGKRGTYRLIHLLEGQAAVGEGLGGGWGTG